MSVSVPSPRHRKWLGAPGDGGLGGAGAQGHPPLLADQQEQKHDQAGDEGQADPHDGTGVIAGPCRGNGWGRLSGLASGPGCWWLSLNLGGSLFR